MITAEHLRSVLSYNTETGVLTWRKGRQGTDVSLQAGSKPNAQGYIQICIDYHIYLAHRLAFLYMEGRWPLYIDHVNGVRTDNRWSNLREATSSQNGANSKRPCTNTTGYKGVTWQAGKYVAQIAYKGKHYYLGRFTNPREAAEARAKKARELHGEFARD